MRVLIQAPLRIGQAHPAQHLDGPGALGRLAAAAAGIGCPSICRPMVSTGLSAVIGSWKTMPMRFPLQRAQQAPRAAEQLLAMEAHRAADARRGRRAGPAPRAW